MLFFVRTVRQASILPALALAAFSAVPGRAQNPMEWKAGAAAAVVTPREPLPLAGFASRKGAPSRGVAAELRVKALALQDKAGKTTVIVTSDLIGLRRALTDVVAERCQKRFGLSRDRLLLNASHTHSGPVLGLSGTEGPYQAAIEKYTHQLLDDIVDVVGHAIGSLAPASLEFNQGLAGFAVNRRRSRPNTRQFPGPVDHDVPVLAVRGAGGLRAVLFGYACHPTTLAAWDVNADYPGYAQAELEKMYPGAVALFVQGCGADANPLPRFHSEDPDLIKRSLELSTMYGRILAAAVDLVLKAKMTPVAGPVATALEYVDIPFEALPPRQELEARKKSGDETRRAQADRLLRALEAGTPIPERYPYPVQVWRFAGGLKLIALAGEVVVDYALRLKAAHGWENTWVAGYSNDVPGYIPSRRVLLEGGYETGGAAGGAFSAAVEETIVEKVDALVRRTSSVN